MEKATDNLWREVRDEFLGHDDSLLSNATAGWVRLGYERNFGMATRCQVPAEAS
jgi:hypothetical protein